MSSPQASSGVASHPASKSAPPIAGLAAAARLLGATPFAAGDPIDVTATRVNSATEIEVDITVAATASPHAEILEQCKPLMAEKGYTLDIKVVDDYVTPNTATENGDVDANYFQHINYLNNFNAENGTHIVSVASIHVEPMGLYGGKQTSLDAIG